MENNEANDSFTIGRTLSPGRGDENGRGEDILLKFCNMMINEMNEAHERWRVEMKGNVCKVRAEIKDKFQESSRRSDGVNEKI